LSFKFNYIKAVLSAILVIAAATAFILILKPSEKPNQYHSRIAVPGFQSSALVILAQEKGFFKEQGVDVSLEYKATGRDCLALAVSGQADLAVVFETPIIRSILEGNEISVLTELHRSENNTAVVARKDRGIENIDDLTGKTVATVAKTNAEFHLDLYLRSHMIDPAKVRIKQMKIDEAVKAVASGEVDGAALWEPYVSQAIHDNPEKFTLLKSSFYSEFSMLAGLRSSLEKKEKESKAILRALIQAKEYFENHNAEARAVVDAKLSEKNFFVSKTAWDQTDIHIGLSSTLLTMFDVEGKWYRSMGDLSEPGHLKNIFFAEYLKELAPEMVTHE
jgi:NitT/TauT family transport system substrate-binding protein